jgi:transposase
MKKEAIQWIMGPGKGIPSRAEKHFGALNWDVSASSYRKWWKNREKLLGDSGSKKRISGGGRKPYLDDSEEKLLVVVIQERAKKDRVTRKWIARTAQHMFQRSDTNFKASENWVTKFIRRNGLTLKRSYVTYEPPSRIGQPPARGAATAGSGAGSKCVAKHVFACGLAWN